jgi:hypothetical protein
MKMERTLKFIEEEQENRPDPEYSRTLAHE